MHAENELRREEMFMREQGYNLKRIAFSKLKHTMDNIQNVFIYWPFKRVTLSLDRSKCLQQKCNIIKLYKRNMFFDL